MRRLAGALLAAGIIAALLATPAAGQETDPLPLIVEDANTTLHPDVILTVSMPSEFVGIELPPSAFSVSENDQAVDVAVTALPSDDLGVVLVLDVSGSMAGEALSAAQDAALSFVEAMPPGVSVSVVTFADDPAVASPFTTDTDEIATAVLGLGASGETALYDGLLLATQQFELGEQARRTVVLLSDGGDTVSETTLELALVGLLGNEISFYAVELQTPENDPVALGRLAAATEGSVVAATDPEALGGIFDEVAAQLINRYEVAYVSEAYGNAAVEVSVSAAGVTATTVKSVRMPAPPAVADTTPVDPEPVPEPEAPVVRPGSLVQLSFFQQSAAFYVGMLLIAAGLAGALYASRNVRLRRKKKSTLASEPVALPKVGRTVGITAIADRAVAIADRSIQGERSGRINSELEQAGVSMRPAEFVVMAGVAGIVGTSIGYVLFGPIGGLAGLAFALAIVRVWLTRKANARKAAFADQLTDTLNLLAGSLRAGFGLLQAIEVVAAEAPSPTAEEFHRVKVEIHLGRDMDEALKAMAARVGSEDFEWVADGIQIHREVGGDIAEIIDSVNETIRARNQTRRRIKALSAEGRVSATVLIILPFALAVFIALANPAYLAELTGSGIGQFLIVAGILGMIVGVIWIRRIIRLDF